MLCDGQAMMSSLDRSNIVDVDLGSAAFKASAHLAANYDPEVFPEPTRFDIHRKPKRILSFGAGPHHCIGNILGRTTIAIAIRRLLARFPKAHLIDPSFVPVYGGAVGELRLQSLPMKIH